MSTNFYIPIIFFSTFIWLFSPIRQYKNFFFLYFLILAISDIFIIVLLLLDINIHFRYYLIISFLLLLSIQKKDFLYSNKIPIFIIGILVIVISIFYDNRIVKDLLFVIMHFLIILRILYFFVIYIADHQAINIFYLVLVFYELTVLTKFLELFSTNFDVITYFILTTGFEIACGLFFCIFKEDSRKITFQIR